jgi:hypothetical protein
VSDQTSTILIKLLSTGDLSALTAGQKQAETLTASLGALRTVLGSLGVGFGLGSLISFVESSEAWAASLGHLAEQAGISVQAFQKLNFAAIDAGLNQSDMASALAVLNRNMGLAAEGSSKQVKAIEELSLNTAELLAMPQEQRIEAIAQAYVHATDKGKAWADVVALLGRNSAHLREVLDQLGATGLAGIKAGPMISDADVAAAEKFDASWERAKISFKAMAQRFLGPGGGRQNPALGGGLLDLLGQGGAPAAAAGGRAGAGTQPQSADDIRKQLQATLDATPQMIAANLALSKALSDEAHQYDTLSQKAAALMAEADEDEAKAKQIQASGTMREDLQLEAKRLLTEAAKLRTQAEKELAAAVKQAETEEARGDAERTRRAEEGIEMLVKYNQAQQAQMQIAIAATEHDYTKTDNERWHEKLALLDKAVADQEEYIRLQQGNVDNDTLSPQAHAKAQNAVESGQTGLARTRGEIASMGPNPNSWQQQWSSAITKLRSSWGTLQQNIAGGLTGAISNGMQSIESNLVGLIQGTENWRAAIRNIATDIETTLLQAFVKMGVEWVAQQIYMAVAGKAINASSVASSAPLAMAQSAIWATPATLATIASWGGAALAAPSEIMAALASTQGMALFETGGYNPGMGITHPGEYIFSAPAVRAIGSGNLERAHQAAVAGGPAGGGRSKPQRMIHVMAPNMVSAKQMARDPSFDNVMLDWSRRRRGEQIET